MAKKHATDAGADKVMSAAVYQNMCEVMIELAQRGYDQEALMMRVANAGEIEPVVKHIKQMRMYLKKHSRQPRTPAPATTKKRGKKGKGGGDGEGGKGDNSSV